MISCKRLGDYIQLADKIKVNCLLISLFSYT